MIKIGKKHITFFYTTFSYIHTIRQFLPTFKWECQIMGIVDGQKLNLDYLGYFFSSNKYS